MSAPKLPSLPTLPPSTPPELQQFLNATKSILDSLTGSTGTAVVTQDDLKDFAGKVPSLVPGGDTSTGSGTGTGPGAGGGPPPPLSGLRATAGFAYVMLDWSTIPYGSSAYTIIYRATVDDFSVAEPVGTSRFLVYSDYVPNFQEYFYWITSVNTDGVEGPPNSQRGTKSASAIDTQFVLDQIEKALTQDQIANGGLASEEIFGSAVIGTAAIKTAAIIDAHILSLGADKVVCHQLSALSANLGLVSAGMIRSPDGTFLIDLASRQILITGPNGQVSDKYTIIQNGVVESYEFINGQHYLSKALTHVEVGIANANDMVQIPGVFTSTPKVMVAPANLQCYDKDYADQDQKLICTALDLAETAPGSKQWQFRAVAQLELGASIVSTPVNWMPGETNSNTADTGIYTTPQYTTQIYCDMQARSVRGYGTPANKYVRRKVYFQLLARPAGSGGAFSVYFTSPDFLLPADISSVMGCPFTATMPAGAWDFFVRAVYSDTAESFLTQEGTVVFETDTITAPEATGQLDESPAQGSNSSKSLVVAATLPSYSLPSGWSFHEVTYTYEHFSWASVELPSPPPDGTRGSVTASSRLPTLSLTGAGGTQTAGSTTYRAAPVVTVATYDLNIVRGTLTLSWFRSNFAGLVRLQAKGGFRNIKVDIVRKQTLTNSTTPRNLLRFLSFSSSLSSAVTLASGTLNWFAVG